MKYFCSQKYSMKSGYLEGALRVLKEKFSLGDSDILGHETSAMLRNGTNVLLCEIFTCEDNYKVCSWNESHDGGKVLHSWFEYTQPSFSEFVKELDRQAENSLFLTLRLREKRIMELEGENQKLLDENKQLREEIMELLYAPGGKGVEIAKRHFEGLSQ
uniref:Uncharacterized protein n=1 Tax=Marseillevirus sp. TaxID=2809551 RepID=A0AA96ER44_9VIRU|nr:hypothetical protein MarFTMF_071 [Marseillevirus sp.]